MVQVSATLNSMLCAWWFGFSLPLSLCMPSDDLLEFKKVILLTCCTPGSSVEVRVTTATSRSAYYQNSLDIPLGGSNCPTACGSLPASSTANSPAVAPSLDNTAQRSAAVSMGPVTSKHWFLFLSLFVALRMFS
eukprot:jgi/Chrzof1/10457/UNPLg00384.t1